MAEWHLPPDYIISNWTDEFLNLMVEKLNERKKREADAIKGTHSESDSSDVEQVSDTELLARMGIKVEHGD